MLVKIETTTMFDLWNIELIMGMAWEPEQSVLGVGGQWGRHRGCVGGGG